MRDKVFYEWAVEQWDLEEEDIEDSSYYDHIDAEFIRLESEYLTLPNYKLCLWKRCGNADEGITDQTWAYFNSGLPECFENGDKIPKYVKKELKNLDLPCN